MNKKTRIEIMFKQCSPPSSWNSPLRLVIGYAGAFLFAAGSYAGTSFELGEARPAGDKSRYHLFNPTPRELMRPLSADRPDKIESPHTVDAGHLQIETDFLSWSKYHNGDERVRTWGGPNPNIKLGLLNNLDIEFAFDTFLSERGRDRSEKRSWRRSGFGDMEVRLKLNLTGNDEGDFAAALLPYAQLPTSRAGLGASKVNGGLIIPVGIELPGGWGLGLQVGGHLVEGEEHSGRHAQIEQAIGLEHDIIGNLAGYIEFYSLFQTERGQGWIGTVDVGLTYAVTEDIQLDCGVNIGVSPAADDLNPFAGITIRF